MRGLEIWLAANVQEAATHARLLLAWIMTAAPPLLERAEAKGREWGRRGWAELVPVSEVYWLAPEVRVLRERTQKYEVVAQSAS